MCILWSNLIGQMQNHLCTLRLLSIHEHYYVAEQETEARPPDKNTGSSLISIYCTVAHVQ